MGESNDKEKELMTNKLNYDFPIPIENLTNGKYTDFDCWEMFKNFKKEIEERAYNNRWLQYWHSLRFTPLYSGIYFSFITDIETNKTWLRIELKKDGERCI
jgi:hypothetical protein